jgi:hypothetical protein
VVQQRTLRKAGRARRVLNLDQIVRPDVRE